MGPVHFEGHTSFAGIPKFYCAVSLPTLKKKKKKKSNIGIGNTWDPASNQFEILQVNTAQIFLQAPPPPKKKKSQIYV